VNTYILIHKFDLSRRNVALQQFVLHIGRDVSVDNSLKYKLINLSGAFLNAKKKE